MNKFDQVLEGAAGSARQVAEILRAKGLTVTPEVVCVVIGGVLAKTWTDEGAIAKWTPLLLPLVQRNLESLG